MKMYSEESNFVRDGTLMTAQPTAILSVSKQKAEGACQVNQALFHYVLLCRKWCVNLNGCIFGLLNQFLLVGAPQDINLDVSVRHEIPQLWFQMFRILNLRLQL